MKNRALLSLLALALASGVALSVCEGPYINQPPYYCSYLAWDKLWFVNGEANFTNATAKWLYGYYYIEINPNLPQLLVQDIYNNIYTKITPSSINLVSGGSTLFSLTTTALTVNLPTTLSSLTVNNNANVRGSLSVTGTISTSSGVITPSVQIGNPDRGLIQSSTSLEISWNSSAVSGVTIKPKGSTTTETNVVINNINGHVWVGIGNATADNDEYLKVNGNSTFHPKGTTGTVEITNYDGYPAIKMCYNGNCSYIYYDGVNIVIINP